MKYRTIGVGLALSAAVATAACSGPETENSFRIQGTVIHVDDDYFRMDVDATLQANGSAPEFLAASETQEVHDGYRDNSCIRHDTFPEYDLLVAAGTLSVGSQVEVVASPGDSKTNCIEWNANTGWFERHAILSSVSVLEP